jgi:glycosyltransferase involved in cell wall biosynthesis
MTITSAPLVSIIIPTYNRAHMLARAIQSAVKQTYPNKQIIVVDDGSVDNTRALVAQYSQVEYIFQKHGGQGKARNTGLAHAKGSYIASLDSDDAWHPDFLQRCIDKLENENISFVFSNWTQVVDNENSFDFFAETKMLKKYINTSGKTWILLENATLRKIYLEGCPSPSSSLVLKRESMPGNWNEQLNIGDDWCLLLDMILLKRCNAAFTTETLWTKRTDGQNLYDGRNNIELIEYLWIKDYSAILERHKHTLKKAEATLLNNKIACFIYELYLYKLFSRKHGSRDNALLKKTLRAKPLLFGPVFFKFVYFGLRRMLNKIR